MKNTVPSLLQFRVQPKSTRESFTSILSSLGIGELRSYNIQYSDYEVPQEGNFSPSYSDHKTGFYPLKSKAHNKALSVLSHNMMAQARESTDTKHANTAFGHKESDEEYIKRWKSRLRSIQKSLECDPSIAFIAFQEAPVQDQLPIFRDCINAIFPKQWRLLDPSIFSDATEWGVFTIINMERMDARSVVMDATLTEDIPIKDIEIRCRTFLVDTQEKGLVKFTNLHLPHNDPMTAFRMLMTKVVQEVIIKGRGHSGFEHSLIGDWNLEPNVIKVLIEQILQDETIKMESKNFHPFCIDVTVASSKKGHFKQDGSILSVDNMVTLAVTPADSFSYTIRMNGQSIAYAGILCTSLFIGGASFKNGSENDECEEMSSTSLK